MTVLATFPSYRQTDHNCQMFDILATTFMETRTFLQYFLSPIGPYVMAKFG